MSSALQLHHIFPKSWCRNNINERNKKFIGVGDIQNNWIDSPSNLMPMHSDTNKKWSAKEPSMALKELKIHSEDQLEMLRIYFIDQEAQSLLEKGSDFIGEFFNCRKNLLVREINKLMRV